HIVNGDAPPPVPRQRPLQKSRTWGDRLSSFFPSLSANDADSAASISSGSRKSSVKRAPPVNTSPPLPSRDRESVSPTDKGPNRPSPPPPVTTGFHDTNQSNATLSSPQIMAPIPPSPELKHPTLATQEPAAKAGTQRISPPPLDPLQVDDLPRLGNLNSSRRSSLEKAAANNQSSSTLYMLANESRGRRSVSAQAQSPAQATNRTSTFPIKHGSVSSPVDGTSTSQSPSRGRMRRSWLPGGNRSRSTSVDGGKKGNKAYAWVMSDDTQAEYNTNFLRHGEKVPELWNESGNVLVYLYPRASGAGPSFKVMDFTISSSYVFNELIQASLDSSSSGRSRTRSFGGRHSLSAEDATRLRSPTQSPPIPDSPGDIKLYLPTATAENSNLALPGQASDAELDRLICIRNLFAFLTGQPLVATRQHPTVFHAFLQIAALLEEFGFCSDDGYTFGNAADLSFEFYVEQLQLADCRNSREKTVQAIVLGERMRSMDLYSEAFAHASGKWSAITALKLPVLGMVSKITRLQLEKAYLDLVQRQHNVNEHLEQFEFPSLFAGIANSTSSAELRQVGFATWRKSFAKMRSFVLSYYKTTFGNWPPKASSSKNPFAESGLNRLVLKVLYSDMCALYDLLVDRTNLTSRVMDEVPAMSEDADKMLTSALRNIMSEFDRSRPPVLPPIPYDLPQLPSMTSIFEAYNSLGSKGQLKFDKRIKEHELILVLNKAYNYDTNRLKLPFLDQFKAFEVREARGKTQSEMADQRVGYWLFLYVVIQSLPMLVIDAPGVKFTEGTEYFLCEPPMGNPPWIEDRQVQKMWYEVAGGGGLVELSTDAVLFSVEATYHRSHCWLAAKSWEGVPGAEAPVFEEPALGALEPPPSFLGANEYYAPGPPSMGGTSTPPRSPSVVLRPRTLSPAGSRASHAFRSSIAIGLEPVPMQPPNVFGGHQRSSSSGPRPMSSALGMRSSHSVGNLSALNLQHQHQQQNKLESPTHEDSGATFDDILQDNNKKKQPAKKRFFF
ncbi:unnamed protein product, partial [Clonostachys chloroleuca]